MVALLRRNRSKQFPMSLLLVGFLFTWWLQAASAQCDAIEPTTCTTDDCGNNLATSCQNLECVARSGCDEMVLSDSQVYCHASSTCRESVFTRSIVSCLGSIACGSNVFVDSAVRCDSGCSLATFDACSCCSGSFCPPDVLRCDNLEELCSKKVFFGAGTTCADRNPLCAVPSTVPPSNSMTTSSSQECGAIEPSSCATDDCGNNLIGKCRQLECVARGGCDEMMLSDSQVYCHASSTCRESIFTRSIVYCLGSITCGSNVFVDSAVQCDSGCSLAAFDACSCCSGSFCPPDVLSCDNLDALCSRIVFSSGVTCAGRNPLCADSNTLPPTNLPTANPVPAPISANPTRTPTSFPTKAPVLIAIPTGVPTSLPTRRTPMQIGGQIVAPVIIVQTPVTTPEPPPLPQPVSSVAPPTNIVVGNPRTMAPAEQETGGGTSSPLLSTPLVIGIVSSVGFVVILFLCIFGILLAKVFNWCCFKPKQKDTQHDDPNNLGEDRRSHTDPGSASRSAGADYYSDSNPWSFHAAAAPLGVDLHQENSFLPPTAEVISSKNVQYKDQVATDRFRQHQRVSNEDCVSPPSVPVAVAVVDPLNP